MKACTRCGDWHTEPERHLGRYMSCTEVKKYWSDMKARHREETGHLAQLKLTKDNRILCLVCGREITP